MKKPNLLSLCLILFSTAFIACSDDTKGGGGGNDKYLSATVKATEYGEWTYFDLETGTTRTLPIKGEEGAVTGIYTGGLTLSVGNSPYGGQDSVKMVVTRISEDSVSIRMNDLTINMSGAEEVTPFTLTANAKATKQNGKWVLTGTENECTVVNGDKTTVWKVVFNGEIGTAKNEAVNITGALTPGRMPFAITATYESVVENSLIYEVNGDESSFDWDLAFHKYDIRTNGGSALMTEKTNLDDITAANIPVTGFTEDTEGNIYADMSQMMDGFVGYQYVKLNSVLCGWVIKTPTGTMPPYTYKLKNNIFVVKTQAGKYVKIQFYDTTNEKDKAVYASFNYEYPVK